MHEELSEQLHRLSTEVEGRVRPALATEVRRRGDRRRSRTAIGAAAVSVTAVAVASPIALGSSGGRGGDGANLFPAGEASRPAAVRPTPTLVATPSPSLGWDTSIQQYNEDLEAYLSWCTDELGFPSPWALDKVPAQPEDEASTWGFRISTVLEGDRSLVDGPAPDDPPNDPIAELRRSLPPGEREPFDAAVEKCWNDAAAAVPPTAGSPDRAIVIPGEDGAFSLLLPAVEGEDGYVMDYHDAVEAMVQADARVVAATALWSACMANAGYVARSPGEIQEQIRDLAQPYRDAYEAGLPPDERGNDAPKSKLLDEVLDADQLAGLAEVQRYERAAAVVSATCDDSLGELVPVVWQDKLDEYFGYTG